MSIRNTVTIVVSPRPRVGKTLLARLLIDFHRHEGRNAEGYDLSNEGTLTQFLPQQTHAAAVADIHGQMALFDKLIDGDGVHKVVDVGHEFFETFFDVVNQTDFAREARRREIAPAVLYVMTPDQSAAKAFAALRDKLPPGALTPVHNELLGGARLRGQYPALGSGGAVTLHVPALAPGPRRAIDKPPFSFIGTDIPDNWHGETERWLRRVFLEFREFHLRLLLADLQSSLQISP